MDSIIIHDEFNQPWRVTEDDELWEEAKAAHSKNGGLVYWPLQKITVGRGWGWWTVFKNIDEFETELEKIVPNPGKFRLIDPKQEYSTLELRNMLQYFGGYLASLHHLEGVIEGQTHALKEGFKTAISISVAKSDSKETSMAGKEAAVLSSNELYKETKKKQINHEATLLVLKGWIAAYTAAYTAVSRIISVELGELSLQTTKTP